MKSTHPLLQNAYVYGQPAKPHGMADANYDVSKGMWLVQEDDRPVPLVKSNDPSRPRPMTKKADRETGEDQKGE